MNNSDFYCDQVFSGKINVNKVFENDRILAFEHTKPNYQIHILIVPKKHIPTLQDLRDKELIKEIFEIAANLIRKKELDKTNFRIITNGGDTQDSKHLHFHLISGNKL